MLEYIEPLKGSARDVTVQKAQQLLNSAEEEESDDEEEEEDEEGEEGEKNKKEVKKTKGGEKLNMLLGR